MAFHAMANGLSVKNDGILIALGANQPSATGAPLDTLRAAVTLMQEAGLRFIARSRWYCTPAFPPGSGPDFVNAAARIETDLTPERVLALLHEVEHRLGRVRQARWAPRACDLDLIAYGALVLPDPDAVAAMIALGPVAAGKAPAPDRLILPHPRVQERAFVLVPLCDVAPGWVHPVLGRCALALRDELPEAALAEVEVLDD